MKAFFALRNQVLDVLPALFNEVLNVFLRAFGCLVREFDGSVLGFNGGIADFLPGILARVRCIKQADNRAGEEAGKKRENHREPVVLSIVAHFLFLSLKLAFIFFKNVWTPLFTRLVVR